MLNVKAPTPRSPKTRLRASVALAMAVVGLWAAPGCTSAPSPLGLGSGGSALAAASVKPSPGWLEGAVVYGAVPPLFGGSPLRDVTARLDYMKQQGVDAVWLSPINASDDPSGISYAVTDYFKVRADFGSQADFKRLVDQAHRRGIKVLMDFVPNHTSNAHPYFKDTVAKGRQSPYWDYYMRDADGKPQFYFDWESLINLNYGHPGVKQHMTEAFAFWVRDMKVDGFRVDAAWGVKDRNPEFWPALAQELRAINPEIFLLAEASARDPYYVKNGFDAAYDWSESLGHWSWEKVWDDPARAGDRLRQALAGRETPPDRVARFLNNNDTGERFNTRYGVETQKVAAVLLHTLPGVPIVYTGEEVAAEFEPYEDPPPIAWEDRHGLRPLYRRLAELREATPALRRGQWTELATANPAAYAFVRDAGAAGQALVVLNFGAAGPVSLALPPSLAGRALKLADALGGPAVALAPGQKTLKLKMARSSAMILVPQR